MYCVMASIDNIVSKNVGKLGKRFLGGVSRKNAERVVSETAKEVKDVFLRENQRTVDSMLKDIEVIKAGHISEINKKMQRFWNCLLKILNFILIIFH